MSCRPAEPRQPGGLGVVAHRDERLEGRLEVEPLVLVHLVGAMVGSMLLSNSIQATNRRRSSRSRSAPRPSVRGTVSASLRRESGRFTQQRAISPVLPGTRRCRGPRGTSCIGRPTNGGEETGGRRRSAGRGREPLLHFLPGGARRIEGAALGLGRRPGHEHLVVVEPDQGPC